MKMRYCENKIDNIIKGRPTPTTHSSIIWNASLICLCCLKYSLCSNIAIFNPLPWHSVGTLATRQVWAPAGISCPQHFGWLGFTCAIRAKLQLHTRRDWRPVDWNPLGVVWEMYLNVGITGQQSSEAHFNQTTHINCIQLTLSNQSPPQIDHSSMSITLFGS